MKLGYKGKSISRKYINIANPREDAVYSNLANEKVLFKNGKYELIPRNLNDFLQYPKSIWEEEYIFIVYNKKYSFLEKIKKLIKCFL